MIPDNVTLIVKAPNQQVEDQNVECQSSWTVRQLKGHLSEVYPSKPRTEEQKIIYSGQLLDDNIILKDVLRTYESQIAHTMHLVCTPTRKMPEPTPTEVPSTDGLRQRNVTTTVTATATPAEPTRPEMRQNDQNHNVEMQNYLTSFANNYGRVPPYPNYNFREGYLPVPNDPALMANHIMMMQQAYLQYMQQYANMWQATATAPAAPAPPAEAPPQVPPPAPPADEEDGMGHDWLDHMYAASRLGILFSLVYLYGSPARLLLVVLLAMAGYLVYYRHHVGFFRELHLQPPNEGNRRNEEANAPERPQNPNAPPPAGDDAPPAPDAPPPPTNNDNQSLLAVTWMIVTSFFASLIPDAN
ncbi:homocysteine-responsive endoplasmic reticulum-resident ubiquitin-like domain member 2 protein isoform X1 [Ostrinia furnacalis]|uniref:homocysteine-responsive endoplasmic reticulum-resident ubiquitin-like domain member 2 protein isoform X1 n=1 Tax=Ostrinia furnacalis TaxID=93504 RepID=UPI00103EE9E0|nr:homocysteine-responsive endoplasmic reticulum-resident ubiquitin-like domain member 2 protein isoform X1 [Ostrinia furnacalis]